MLIAMNAIIRCEHCQLNVTVPKLEHRQRAICPRCGHQLTAHRRGSVQSSLAFSLSGLIFLVLSLGFDFLSFKASGQQNTINLIQGLITLSNGGYVGLALITGLATLILPGSVLVCIGVLQVNRLLVSPNRFSGRTFIWIKRLMPWSMAEIFLVGTLVSLIKITSLADVVLGMSFYAYVLFTVCYAFTLLYFDREETQRWLDPVQPIIHSPVTQASAAYSVQRTWALLFTAMLLYIPANTLPIMHTNLLGNNEPSTIISGVKLLWESGSYPVASVIFVASVVVPIAKLIALAWLNFSVQKQHSTNQTGRALSYRLTEIVGRWSMIDVFVVAILVALIQLGNTMSIYPGPAVFAFCAVVFITMMAAMTFDSRLIWYKSTQHDE